MTEPSPVPTNEARSSPPLDEVMLAMDVVDTLRAQKALVEQELDGEGRARSFADRVKSIYASQGIDVPDAVIQAGVKALEQDRFTYRPPERTLSVRLAELYVDRGIWFRRLLGLAAILALVGGAMAWSRARHDKGLEEAFASRQGLFSRDVETTGERIQALGRQLADAASTQEEGSVVAGLSMQASALLGDVDARYRALTAEEEPLDARAYPDDQRRMDAQLEARRRAVAGVQEDLSRVEGQLDTIRKLQGLRGRITVVMARLSGLELAPEQEAELERLRRQALAALQAGDADAAEARVGELRDAVIVLVGAAETRRRLAAAFAAVEADLDSMDVELAARDEVDQLRGRLRAALEAGDLQAADVRLLELQTMARVLGTAYELHIISRPGLQSGVWRIPDDSPTVRNYYILVEPIGADGRPVSIPVRNEENQTTVMVTKLGIRVPEKVFEAVKADKMDNGIVDRKVFGVKRRGQRSPEYRYDTAGGWITDW